MKKIIGMGLAAITLMILATGCSNTIFANEKAHKEVLIKKDRVKDASKWRCQ